jgi:hypothetical protein
MAVTYPATATYEVTGFSPTQIPGLTLWLNSTSLALTNGAAVASWNDDSGSGNTVTQGTSSQRPTFQTGQFNGRPCVRFDGVDDNLIAPSLIAPQITLFSTHKYRTAFFQFSQPISTGPFADFYLDSGTTNISVGRNGVTDEARYPAAGNVLIDTWYCHALVIDTTSGTYTSLYLNGVSKASLTTASTGGAAQNGLSVSTGAALVDIAEVIKYDARLTDSQIAQVAAYMLRS